MTETDWPNYAWAGCHDVDALKRKCITDYGSAALCQYKQVRKPPKLGGFYDCILPHADGTCSHKRIQTPTVHISLEGLHYARACPTCDQSLCALSHIRRGWHTRYGKLVEQICPTCNRWDKGGIWAKTTDEEHKDLHIFCYGGPMTNECCEHFHLPDCEHRRIWAEEEAERKLEDEKWFMFGKWVD